MHFAILLTAIVVSTMAMTKDLCPGFLEKRRQSKEMTPGHLWEFMHTNELLVRSQVIETLATLIPHKENLFK